MGAKGPHRQAECKRGHPLVGFNAMSHAHGGYRCRACNRAVTHVHNQWHRWGVTWDEADLQRISDYKWGVIEALMNKSALTSGK